MEEKQLVMTESTEPANGSDKSKGSIVHNLLSSTAVEQRQKEMTHAWLHNLLSLENTRSQAPYRRFVKILLGPKVSELA